MNDSSFGLDLSYLTSDERRIIDDVLRRQKEEEDRNTWILRGLQEDYDRIAQAVRNRLTTDDQSLTTDQPKDLRTVSIPNGGSTCFDGSGLSAAELASMCQICRTHIPDIPIEGIRIAHCHYCGLRVCYRCGNTLSYKAKTVWTCALCRKRHELLVKTGQWATSNSEFEAGFYSAATSSLRRTHPRSRSQEPSSRSLIVTTAQNVSKQTRGQIVPLPGQPLDLRRHISSSSTQIDSLGLTDSFIPDFAAEWSNIGQSAADIVTQPRYSPRPQFTSPTITNLATEQPMNSWQNEEYPLFNEQSRPNSTISFNQTTAGLLRTGAPADRVSSTLPRHMGGSFPMRPAQSLPRLSLGNVHLPLSLQARIAQAEAAMPHNFSESRMVRDQTSCSITASPVSTIMPCQSGRTTSSHSLSHHTNHAPQSSTPVHFCVGRSNLRRSKLATMGHQDSLDSDPSSDFGGGMVHSSSSTSYNVNASPIMTTSMPRTLRNHASRSNLPNRRALFAQIQQTSSSEEEMRSTPDYLSESDLEFEVAESGSVSERLELDSGEVWPRPTSNRLVPSSNAVPLGAISGSGVLDPLTCGAFPTNTNARTSPSQPGTHRQKLVRFQRGASMDYANVPSNRDSGLETASSTQTLNEDGSKFRMDWQRSPDGSTLIGKFSVLRNNRGETSSRILGLKVVGGKLGDNGQLGAIVTKVKRGSVADTVGRLRPGDEVVEWNGVHLKGLSFEQVYEVIGSTRDCRKLDLIVHRHLLGRLVDEPERPRSSSSNSRRHSVTFGGIIPLGSPPLTAQYSQPETDLDAGRLQIKLWLDTVRSELAVTVVSARDLLPIGVASATTEPPPHAFCVITLTSLDNNSGSDPFSNSTGSTTQKGAPSRRWTNRHPPSWEPRWDQLFQLWPVSCPSSMALDAAVYDAQPPDGCCDSDSTFTRCIGCVTLMLNEVPLNNEPYWYRLTRPEPGSRSGPGIIPPMMSTPTRSATAESSMPSSANSTLLKSAQKKQPPPAHTPKVMQASWQGPSLPSQQTSQQLIPPIMTQSAQHVSFADAPSVQPNFVESSQNLQQQPQMQQQQQLAFATMNPQQQTQGFVTQNQQFATQQPQQWNDPTNQQNFSIQQQPQQQFEIPMTQQQQQYNLAPQVMFDNTGLMPMNGGNMGMGLPNTGDSQQPLQNNQSLMEPFQNVNSNLGFSGIGQQPSFAPNTFDQQQFQLANQGIQPTFSLASTTQSFSTPMPSIAPLQSDQSNNFQYAQNVPANLPSWSQPATIATPFPEPQLSTPMPAHQTQFGSGSSMMAGPPPFTTSQTLHNDFNSAVTPLPQSVHPLMPSSITSPGSTSQQPIVPPVVVQQGPMKPLSDQSTTATPKSILHNSITNIVAAASEAESDNLSTNEEGDHGRLYRKHSQVGQTSTLPPTSLARRVARHRSDASNAVAGSSSSLAASDSEQTTSLPSNNPIPPPLQLSQQASALSSSLSTIPPVTPPPISANSESEKTKRHVRLAPEVSFIVGNDEPPIQLPLASESGTSLASLEKPAVDLEPLKTAASNSASNRRPSLTGYASAPTMSRASSVVESVISDAESAISANEASDGAGESRPKSRSSISESETAGGYSSGGEHGQHSDGSKESQLQAQLQKKSLWGTAAKKMTIGGKNKSAFPSVVDSVIAQNMAGKNKKKTGINRCGDEVVQPAPSAGSSGFDMSAGFFDGDLGPGQVVGRQMLGATAIGELEIGLREIDGRLTITLVAARDLMFKHKTAPSVYSKAALVVGQSTQERLKSVPQQVKDADPQLGIEFAFQSQPFRDKMLQISLWAAYGKMSGRHCLGAVAIKLEEIQKFPIRAMYKLYDPAAVGGFVASIATEGPAVASLI